MSEITKEKMTTPTETPVVTEKHRECFEEMLNSREAVEFPTGMAYEEHGRLMREAAVVTLAKHFPQRSREEVVERIAENQVRRMQYAFEFTAAEAEDEKAAIKRGVERELSTLRSEEVEEALGKELRRWQEAIRDTILNAIPDARIDGRGEDSGDPLDFTLSEVSQGLIYLQDRLYDEKQAFKTERELTKQLADERREQREAIRVLRDALKKCLLELRYCSDQLTHRGCHKGWSVTEAENLSQSALTATSQYEKNSPRIPLTEEEANEAAIDRSIKP